jgi:hypothetical protein
MDSSVKMMKQQRRTQCDRPLQCTKIYCQRCNRMQKLNLLPLPQTTSRAVPNFTQTEGPNEYGFHSHYCSDCSGCDTKIATCFIDSNTNEAYPNGNDACSSDTNSNVLPESTATSSSFYTGPAYGGFLSIEFARDVELQTEEYSTTQENSLSKYIATNWNAPIEMLYEFGRPICLVSTGLHDMAIPNATKAAYLQNVQWYLQLVSAQCDYVIWLSNNCPLTNDMKQKQALTHEWNMAVQNMILSPQYPFRYKSFYLDVFNSSIAYEHADNIHMSRGWYEVLASFLLAVMNIDLGSYE